MWASLVCALTTVLTVALSCSLFSVFSDRCVRKGAHEIVAPF